MPLPLAHAAIGCVVYEAGSRDTSVLTRVKVFLFVAILSNLPDLDIIAGLLIESNGNSFHRGPTHSFLFALLAGFVASKAWRVGEYIPKLSFPVCFAIILSHILADGLLTSSPVSYVWPFEVNFCGGQSSFTDIVTFLLYEGFKDAGIVSVCVMMMIYKRTAKTSFEDFGSLFNFKKRSRRMRTSF